MSKVEFRRLDYDAVLEQLRRAVAEQLAPRPEVREVVLIGSLARGDWSACSDADLVVIVDRSDERVIPFRSTGYLPRDSVGVPIDVFVYTAEEAKEWGPRYRSEIETGVLLYGRSQK